MRITDEFDPTVVHGQHEDATVQSDVDLAATAEDQWEGGHHGTLADEDARRLHLLVVDDVRRLEVSVRVQDGRRVDRHGAVAFRHEPQLLGARRGRHSAGHALVVAVIRSQDAHQMRIQWGTQYG